MARGHVATIPGTCLSNLKFVPLAILELLAFNAQKFTVLFTGSRDSNQAHFSETFVRVMSGLYLETRLANLKFVSLAVLELLAFNTQKFTGSRDPDHAHISETVVSSHVGTISGNTPAKFEVRIFSRFGAISIYRPKIYMGHVTRTTPTFRKHLSGSCRDYAWEHACQI